MEVVEPETTTGALEPEQHQADPLPRRVSRQDINRVLGVLFGVAGPALCLYVTGGMGRLFFGMRNLPACSMIAVGVAWMIVWLIRPPTRPWLAALGLGVFAVGTCFAGTIGLILLWFNMSGLAYGTGLLGLIPFGTALIYGRLTTDAWRIARVGESPRRWFAALLGAGMVIAVPVGIEGTSAFAIRVASDRLLVNDPASVERAARALEAVPWFDNDELVDRWKDESDRTKRLKLNQLFFYRTGMRIQDARPWLAH